MSKKTEGKKDDKLSDARVTYAYYLSILGFAVILVLIICLAMLMFPSSDIIGMVGVFTSVFGTIIGMFFGVQMGSKATENAEKASQENGSIAVENKKIALQALLAVDPNSEQYQKLQALINQ